MYLDFKVATVQLMRVLVSLILVSLVLVTFDYLELDCRLLELE